MKLIILRMQQKMTSFDSFRRNKVPVHFKTITIDSSGVEAGDEKGAYVQVYEWDDR